MVNYVNRVLVGKAAGTANTGTTLSNIALGDILVLDENFAVLDAAGAAAAKKIFIAQGVGNNKAIMSSEIVKADVVKFTEQAFAAAVAQVSEITPATFVVDKEYKLSIDFKDDLRLISNRQTRVDISHTAKTATAATELAAIADKVNKHRVASTLVVASVVTGKLVLTGKAVPTKSINDYEFVTFGASFVDIEKRTAVEAVTTTKSFGGNGLPVQIRQMERMALGYLGFNDLRDFRTNKDVPFFGSDAAAGGGYDMLTLVHMASMTGDFQQPTKFPAMTNIAVAAGSAQATAVKDRVRAFISGVAVTPPAGE
jgi:hypothetical protein